MIIIDAQTLVAIAALIGSISSLVWSIRRSPGRDYASGAAWTDKNVSARGPNT